MKNGYVHHGIDMKLKVFLVEFFEVHKVIILGSELSLLILRGGFVEFLIDSELAVDELDLLVVFLD